ncbi:MAG: hypothetical protein FWD31_04530, partial [Planctomycetaceae bacterium]|nr:hypothetical protein [Planctomycetaceae bacterium]
SIREVYARDGKKSRPILNGRDQKERDAARIFMQKLEWKCHSSQAYSLSPHRFPDFNETGDC